MPVQQGSPTKKIKTARGRLEVGQLTQAALTGREGYDDTDLTKFVLVFQGQDNLDIRNMITSATLTRTIEGASTLEVTFADPDRLLLNSGRLARGCDVELDGLWFRLQRIKKSGDKLTLSFEDRTIAILRTYARKLGPIPRTKLTRAEFVLKMIEQVQEFEIPWFIPELHDIQPIVKEDDDGSQFVNPIQRGGGIAPNAGTPNDVAGKDAADRQKVTNTPLTVRGAPANVYQIAIANQILRTGKSLGASRKVLVTAIMVGIQETNLSNKTAAESPVTDNGKGFHVGVFQQDPRYWTSLGGASRDVAADAAAFFGRAMGYARNEPNIAYHLLGEKVQNSGLPLEYAKRRTEAERFVTEFGVPGGDKEKAYAVDPSQYGTAWTPINGSDNEYYFYRGKPPTSQSGLKPENTWECIQRLADDIQWRAFFVGQVFYYCNEQYLFKSAAVTVLDEQTDGVDSLDFDSDQNKQQSIITASVWMRRWAAPPGSVVRVRNLGPSVGKFLVTEVSRDLFSEKGTVVLKKPWLALPEPNDSNLTDDVFAADTPPQLQDSWGGVDPDANGRDDNGSGDVVVQGGLTPKEVIDRYILPVAKKHGMVTGIDPAAVAAANAVHGHTVDGNRSDHEGPPDYAWAADMSNSGTNYRDERDTTPQMQALANDLAKRFGIPWSGSGASSVINGGFRYNLLYRTLIGGNHYNHVHLGVKKV
jgi:hypothetical protein